MKKLLFIAVAAACGAAMAIESANIVGYATGGLRAGNKAVGAQFAAISGTTIDLTDIKVTGYDPEAGTAADVYVQGLDASGYGTGSYYYYDVPGELTGWLDSADTLVEPGTVVLAAGEGLWVSAPNTSFGLQTGGQVPMTGIAVALRQGNKLVANSTPVAVDLTAIAVTGYDPEVGTAADVYVQGLDASGYGTGSYYYYDVPGELTGWLDSADEIVEASTVMIGAGEALWVSAPSTSYSLVLPGVTL